MQPITFFSFGSWAFYIEFSFIHYNYQIIKYKLYLEYFLAYNYLSVYLTKVFRLKILAQNFIFYYLGLNFIYRYIYITNIRWIINFSQVNLFLNFNLLYTYSLPFFISFYYLVRASLFSILLALSFFFFLSFYFFILTFKQLGIWFLICGFFFWLLSGFNFFLKRYRFGKATSAIYRFWKRTNMCFWLIEGFLFLIFFYYYLNSSAEPIYFYDFSASLRSNLFSCTNAYFNFIYLLFVLVLLYYILLALSYLHVSQLFLWFFICSIFIFYLFFIETYQFYYLLNGFLELTTLFMPEHIEWVYEFESSRLRLKQQYLSLCLIAKYWHFLFIFFSWVFLLLKSLEQKRFYYTLVGVNIQNFLILFILNSLVLIEWVKWVYRRFFDLSYSWFFISPNYTFVQQVIKECRSCLLICLNPSVVRVIFFWNLTY